jgi:tRNA threonylcarbamoyladenosine biosynthesis protein TsaB
MRLLGLDTATEACSAALFIDGELAERYQLAPREHGSLILPMIESLLNEAGLSPQQLDGLAFGRGPGSFTGVRIAAGVAQGIAYGAELPVVPVSTLAAIAQGIHRQTGAPNVLAAIDARMQEIYWGQFQMGVGGLMASAGPEVVVSPAQAPLPKEGRWTGAGTGWGTYGRELIELLGERVVEEIPSCFPHAQDILALARPAFETGDTLTAEQALPVYLRAGVKSSNI